MLRNDGAKAEAVVIGGGIFGAAIAHRLSAKLPGGVALLERNRFAGGSTAKAATLLSLARDKAYLIPWVKSTYALIGELSKTDGDASGITRVGALHLARTEDGVAAIDGVAGVSQANGVKARLAEPGEVAARLPWIDAGGLEKAWWYEEEAFIDAYRLTMRLIGAARENGCRVMEAVAAERILMDDSGVCGVATNAGVICSRRIILAAGIHSNTLLTDIGLAIPMAPVRSQYWISQANPTRFPRRQPICIMPDARAYTRPENGCLIFGWRERNGVWTDPRVIPSDTFSHKFASDPGGWDSLAGCAESMFPYFPGLENVGIAHYIAGFSGYAPDSLFCVGTFPGLTGLTAAAGCSGMGIAVCGGVGLVAAQLALGDNPSLPAAPFAPDRFGLIDPFAEDFMRRCSDARAGKSSG